MREALDETFAQRILAMRHDDWDGASRRFDKGEHRTGSYDDIHTERDQLGHEFGVPLRHACSATRLGHEVTSIDVAKLAHGAKKCLDDLTLWLRPGHLGCCRTNSKETNVRRPAPLLGLQDVRPKERSTGKRSDKLAPIYCIPSFQLLELHLCPSIGTGEHSRFV